MDICTENSFILNSFRVHKIWIISVLSLMPKGEIVGIKLVLPSVTTLSNITDSTNTVSTGQYSVYRAIQCLPSNTVSTKLRSYVVSTELRVKQCLPSTVQKIVFTEHSTEHSVYRVTRQEQCLPRNSVYRVNLLYRVSSGY